MTGTSPNLKRKRIRPAKTDREAQQRWGFAGAAQRGELPAYTGEHYIKDIMAGIIERKNCPQSNPLKRCTGNAVIVTTITKRLCKHRSLRRRTRKGICLDCAAWMAWQARHNLDVELGKLDYVTSKIGQDKQDMDRRQREEMAVIVELAGPIEGDQHLDYYETHVIAYNVSRCIGRWQAACL